MSPLIKWYDTIAGDYYTVNGEHDFVFNVSVTGTSLSQCDENDHILTIVFHQKEKECFLGHFILRELLT